MYRQGDVLLLPIRHPVSGTARPAQAGRLILMYGEVTGHHHSVPVQSGVAVLDAPEGTTYLSIDALLGSVELTHQEHATISLPAGTYRIVRQREWTDAEEPRQVRD